MEKLLTIVVPAYNVEKYIKNCLDSFIDLSVPGWLWNLWNHHPL